MLIIKDLEVYYGSIHALKGINLRVEAGEIAVIVGANGAGKSTTLETISGLIKAKKGEVVLEGESINHLPPHAIVKRGISHSLEGRQIFPKMTAMENLSLGAYSRADKRGVAVDLEWVLKQFPVLKERRNQLAGTLSGGEQQMLAIGRALMSKPKLLILDEPSLGLAPLIVRSIFEAIKSINQQGVTLLLVEQNAKMALSIATRAYVMETGKIILEGPAKELMQNEIVKRAYLG